jgi:hypothetical protein
MLHPPVPVEDTVVPLLAVRGGVSPCGWGDASLSTPTEVTVVAAGDTAAATPEGGRTPC